jgi:hypothetical protein
VSSITLHQILQMRKFILISSIIFLNASWKSIRFEKNVHRQEPRTVFNISSTNSQGQYTLNYKSPARGPLTIMIFDITGKYVYIKNHKDFNGELKELIDLGAYPRGIYVFEVETNDSRETKKIVYQ